MKTTAGHFIIAIVVSTYSLLAIGCGDAEPTCEECLAQTEPALSADGCWPYCEGETADADGDGIADTADTCPSEPETSNGYEDTDGCPDTAQVPPVDPRMGGEWLGTLTSGAFGGLEAATTVSIVVSGSSASVTGFCPLAAADGIMQISGSHDTLHWSGSLTCAPFTFVNCTSVVVTWTDAIIASSVGSTLSATLEGSASGCDRVEGIIATFRSSR